MIVDHKKMCVISNWNTTVLKYILYTIYTVVDVEIHNFFKMAKQLILNVSFLQYNTAKQSFKEYYVLKKTLFMLYS